MSLLSPIAVHGRIASAEHIRAAVTAMQGRFTNMNLAGAMMRAGFTDDFWACQEVANRLLQKFRRAGFIRYTGKVWTFVPGKEPFVELLGKAS